MRGPGRVRGAFYSRSSSRKIPISPFAADQKNYMEIHKRDIYACAVQSRPCAPSVISCTPFAVATVCIGQTGLEGVVCL